MKLINAKIEGFRRLEYATIDFEESETVFIGPNNSGKTSATDLFRLFLRSGEFSVHDFSVSQVGTIDKFGRSEVERDALPHIQLDLWFSINPDTEFGRVSVLLPDTEHDYDKVGIRLRYMAVDPSQLKDDYFARFPPKSGGSPPKSLSYFLALPGMLKQYFGVAYFALESSNEIVIEKPRSPEEGKRVLKSLLRAEFVDAQRKLDDNEQIGSTRLSNVLTGYYKRNLTQALAADAATDLLDKHNAELTTHYATVFADLFKVIEGLGVPSVNDRALRVISDLAPERVLQSNATLTYFDATRQHELPEKYNGLGVKHLIYLAIQICEHHLNWMNTEVDRPLALVLFIEEPEVHLHAQAQQTFVQNAWRIIHKASQRCNERGKWPQLVLTTHSSHILDTVDFASVRYFRRSHCAGEDSTTTTTLNASTVVNLKHFVPIAASTINLTASEISNSKTGQSQIVRQQANTTSPNTDGENSQQETRAKDALSFLKKYMKLTHCDLFFSDAAVLVEGTVEKLLLPEMIEREAPGLRQRYLTVLEVGGAYCHVFTELLDFISIPYLIVTDVDSVDPKKKRAACRADTLGAKSSNATLRFFFPESSTVKDLIDLDRASQWMKSRRCYVTFQRPSSIADYPSKPMHGRTFEETFIYENLKLFRDGSLSIGVDWAVEENHEAEYTAVYNTVRSDSFEKTAFALQIATSHSKWSTPGYISEGLKWLQSELRATALVEDMETSL